MSDLARVCWDVLRLRPPVMAWSLRTHETVFTASVELSGAEFSTDCSSVQGGCHSHQTGTRPGRAGGEAGQYVTKLLQPPAATNMKSKFEQVVQPVRPHNSACCTVPKQREATAVSHTHTPSTGPRGVTNMFQPTHSTTFSPHTSIPRISSDVRQSPARPPVTSQFRRTLMVHTENCKQSQLERNLLAISLRKKTFPFFPTAAREEVIAGTIYWSVVAFSFLRVHWGHIMPWLAPGPPLLLYCSGFGLPCAETQRPAWMKCKIPFNICLHARISA